MKIDKYKLGTGLFLFGLAANLVFVFSHSHSWLLSFIIMLSLIFGTLNMVAGVSDDEKC